tara:strand:- start:82291 stop:84555 length:2265 start_codon:yes stop_codon:yes gene_type:complete
MFDNIKLTTVSWIIGIFLAVATLIILVSATVVQHNINFIESTWQVYQTDRSEKARLETALRSEIGFDGMIHSFKNYVLRHQSVYKQRVTFHVGSAEGIIKQYRSLDLDEAERAALDDLLIVLNNYVAAAEKVEIMLSQGRSTTEMDQAVKVDDAPALRALRTLRAEVIPSDRPESASKLSKSRLAADLRATLGYGGMIHLYKNYLLRYENTPNSIYNQTMLTNIEKDIQAALAVIAQYHQSGTTSAEKMALEDIENVLAQYQSKTKEISLLAQKNMTVEDIDQKVQVDDALAIRGLKILDSEIYRQLNIRSQQVSDTLKFVIEAIKIGKWVSVATVVIVMVLILWMLRITVIRPVMQLISSMVKLADDQLDTEIPDSQQHNEIGQMAHSVGIFKKNMVAHHDSQQELILNNKLMAFKLDEISKLRGLADEQSRRSLALAESMAEARVSTEKLMNQLQDDKKLVSAILNAVQDGIITIGANGLIETFNIGAEQIFGYKSFEVINKNVSMLMPEPQSNEHDGYLLASQTGQSKRDQTMPLEATAVRKNGEHFPVEIMLNPIEIDKEMKTMGVVRDITERKSQQEKIHLLAMTDPLTELANRHQYNAILDKEAKQALRLNTQFALLFIDLDKFKPVNDTYGHPVGDALLQYVAKELLASCREIDLVARIGGDEFAILALGIKDPNEVSTLAERIIEALSKPVTMGPHTLQVGASIGISYFPKDSSEIEELTRMADEALYVAKQEGRNTYRYYSVIKS